MGKHEGRAGKRLEIAWTQAGEFVRKRSQARNEDFAVAARYRKTDPGDAAGRTVARKRSHRAHEGAEICKTDPFRQQNNRRRTKPIVVEGVPVRAEFRRPPDQMISQ